MKDWKNETADFMMNLQMPPNYYQNGIDIEEALSERDAEIARLQSDRLEMIASQQMAGLMANVSVIRDLSEHCIDTRIVLAAKKSFVAAKALMAAVDKEAK